MYDPDSLIQHFDEYGIREWERLVASPVDEISLHIHTLYLRQYIPAGSRVLEIGAGAGRFTQVLAEIGARVVVADISPQQLALNRQFAAQYHFAHAVEDWHQVDMTDLSRYPDASFDRVVAYGGPFSYVIDRRDQALVECLRVLRPGGLLLASVMCLWGSAHQFLAGVLNDPPEYNQRIISTGDLTPATAPHRNSNFMHMFRARELRSWLEASHLRLLALSASGVLASGHPGDELTAIRLDLLKWTELLRMEVEASAEPGALDMGSHLLFVAQK